MSRRRNVKIVRGQYEGRTGTILRFDGNLAYIQIDGGTDAKSDGTAKAGCALRRWIRSEHWERTGDTPRKVKPKYDFVISRGWRFRGEGGHGIIPQTPENYPLYDFMQLYGIERLQVEDDEAKGTVYHRWDPEGHVLKVPLGNGHYTERRIMPPEGVEVAYAAAHSPMALKNAAEAIGRSKP